MSIASVGNDDTWRAVKAHLQARVEVYVAQALDLGKSAEERRDAAVRVDELRTLLTAPEDERLLAQQLRQLQTSEE